MEGSLLRAAENNYAMLTGDPPDHARLRGHVGTAFAVKSINGLDPRNRSAKESLLGAIVDSYGFDLLESVAIRCRYWISPKCRETR
ncbi:MAG: hypothetical protein OXC26_15930 [Albidovulum sp.]|nr:hypothetical protein [Albidovulum sp.]